MRSFPAARSFVVLLLWTGAMLGGGPASAQSVQSPQPARSVQLRRPTASPAGVPNAPAGTRPAAHLAHSAAADRNAVETVVVTADRRREAARQVANSVTAITGRTLDQRQQVRLQDLAAQVPGLSLEADSASAVRIVLRGLNSGSAGATVATVLDDVPTSPVNSQGNAAINTPNFDTFDLQRIEVLKGPQSTLYGATAEGGIVKYVTNAPDPTRYSGAFEGTVDGVSAGGVGGAARAWGNFPLVQDKLAVRVTAWSDNIPGYVDNPQTGKTDTNSVQQYGYRVSALWQPMPELTVRALAQRESLFVNNQDYVEAVGAGSTSQPLADQLDIRDGLRNDTNFSQPSQAETGVYSLDVSDDLGPATLTSVTSYAFTDFKNVFDYSDQQVAPGLDFSQYLGGAIYGGAPQFRIRENSDNGKFNQEVRLSSGPDWEVFNRKLTWLGGFYFTHENTFFAEGADALAAGDGSTPLTPLPGSGGLVARLSEWAAFGSLDYSLLPTVDLAIGGRVEGNTQYAQNSADGLVFNPAGTVYPAFSTNEHDQLYSIAPRWRPNGDTTVYARIATGFRPGGPNSAVPGLAAAPPSYQPDRVVNYEAGVRQDFFRHKVAVDLTGFWVDWNGIQILTTVDTAAGPFSLTGNAGRAQSKGVEWDLAWTPIQGLRLEAVGDYADARLSTDAPALGGSAGDQLPYVPAVSTSVNVDYSFPVNDRIDAYLSGSWSFTGVRYTAFTTAATVQNHVQLPSFNTGSIRAGLTRGRYNLEAFINNISDTRGIAFYQSSGGIDSSGLLNLIQPRTIGLTARVSF